MRSHIVESDPVECERNRATARCCSAAARNSSTAASFEVKAGDNLSVGWLLATNETSVVFGMDYGFADVDGHLMTLASARSANTPVSQPYPVSTTPGHLEYTFPRSGTIGVAFGVVDLLAQGASTALGVDEHTLTAAVPQPGPFVLPTGGLGFWA